MTPKTTWKRNAEQAEKLLRACEDGCHKLRLERDAAERQMREAIVRADMPRPRDEQKWVEWTKYKCPAPSRWCKDIESEWVAIVVLPLMGFIFGALIIILSFLGEMKEMENSPHETVRYVQRHDPELVGKLLVCQDSWRQDERTIRKLERRLNENEADRKVN